MAEYKTMRVPKDAWEQAQDARGENETWGEYLLRCAEEPKVVMSEDEVRRLIQAEIRNSVIDEAQR